MSGWIIVAIVAIVMSSLVKIHKLKHDSRHGIDRDEYGKPLSLPKDDPAARREIEDLRERIKVLERIATDGNMLDGRETRRISDEIEALRDRQDG